MTADAKRTALERRARYSAEPFEHRNRIVARFNRRFPQKYDGGQLRHGGELASKPRLLFEAENEFLDGISYITTLREQLESVLHLVEAGVLTEDVDALIDAREILRDILEEVS